MKQKNYMEYLFENINNDVNLESSETVNQSLTVKDLADKYFKVKSDLKPTSLNTLKSKSNNWILPYFGETKVCNISRSSINEWFDILKTNLAPVTVKGTRNLFRDFLDVAVDYYGFEENLARNMKLTVKFEPKKPFKIWTYEDFTAFIEKVGDPHLHLFYNILFHTGMRLGEILGLQYRDINTETGEVVINKNLQNVNGEYIYLKPKTSKSERTVFLPEEVLEEYRDYLDLIEMNNSHRSRERIFKLTEYKYRSYVKKVCKKNGLTPITLHGFRHSLATELVSQGLPINYISKWLGHAKVSTTMDIYTHDNQKGNKKILNCLNHIGE